MELTNRDLPTKKKALKIPIIDEEPTLGTFLKDFVIKKKSITATKK